MPKRPVLLVEDEDALREELDEFLTARGFAVRSAGDVVTALTYLEDGWVPEVIVTDLYLGADNGMAIVRAVRTMQQLANLPVVLISGHTNADETRALLDPRTRFLAKPVDLTQLLALLAA